MTRLDHAPRQGVRTFTPRWRNSPLTDERMERLLPARQVPDGPLHPERVFGRVAPLVLEIGSGHGAAAIAFAAAHPDADVLALEVHVPGVARMLAAAEAAGVDNLRVHCGDALPYLAQMVPDGSVSAVHLFFPDPWLKKRHTKRRFVQQHTLTLLHRLLRPEGVVRVATDQEPYAAHVRAQVDAHPGWVWADVPRPDWRPMDGFEPKGIRAGRAIHDLELRWVPLPAEALSRTADETDFGPAMHHD